MRCLRPFSSLSVALLGALVAACSAPAGDEVAATEADLTQVTGTKLDETIGLPWVSPDGTKAVYTTCQGFTFWRDLSTGARRQLGSATTMLNRIGEVRREGVVYAFAEPPPVDHVGFLSWDATVSTEALEDKSSVWDVWPGPDMLTYAAVGSTLVGAFFHDDRFRIWRSGAPPFTTASLPGASNVSGNILSVVSADGRFVGHVGQTAGGASQLAFARAEADAPVTTKPFPGRWSKVVDHGKVGSGMLVETDVGLVFADLATGATTTLTTRAVRDGNLAFDRDGSLLFLDLAGDESTVGTWSLRRWSPATPDVAPATLATGTAKLERCYARHPAAGDLSDYFVGSVERAASCLRPLPDAIVFAIGKETRVLSRSAGTDRSLCTGCIVQTNDANVVSYDDIAGSEARFFVEDLGTGDKTEITFPGADPTTAAPSSIRVSRDGKRVFRASYDYAAMEITITSGDVTPGAPVTKLATFPFAWNTTSYELVPVLADSAILYAPKLGASYLVR